MRRLLPVLSLAMLLTTLLALLLRPGSAATAAVDRQAVQRSSFLVITKTAPALVQASERITYELTVHNTGLTPLTSVSITDAVPANATFVTVIDGMHNSGLVSWFVPTLAEDEQLTVYFAVTATQTITNVGYGARAFGNIATGAVPPVVTEVLPPAPQPRLVLTKSAPATVFPGASIVYSVVLRNSGAVTATNVVITDRVPANATYVAGSGGTLVGDVVRWTLPSLAAGAAVTRTFAVTAATPVVNADYRATADGAIAVSGAQPVTTTILSNNTWLPIVQHTWRVEEPNDGCASAYPIASGVPYRFSPDDRDDWYVIDLTTLDGSRNVEFALRDFTPINGQIVIYRGPNCAALQTVANNGDAARTKIVRVNNAPADRYVIWVINDGPLLGIPPYTLQVTVP